jgi:hypothetical protein
MSHCKHHQFCQCESCVCPDCNQRLDEPARPLFRLFGQDVWCATCEYAHIVPTISDHQDIRPIEAIRQLPTVDEGIAQMNADMAAAQASGDHARILREFGRTMQVSLR